MPASEGQHFQFTLRGVLVLLTLASLPLAFFTRASGGWWISVQVIAALAAVWLYLAGSVPRTDRPLILGCVAILTVELLVSYLAGLSTAAWLLIYLPLLLAAAFGFLIAFAALLQGLLPDSRLPVGIWPRTVTRGCVLLALVPVLPLSPAFRLGMRDRIHIAGRQQLVDEALGILRSQPDEQSLLASRRGRRWDSELPPAIRSAGVHWITVRDATVHMQRGGGDFHYGYYLALDQTQNRYELFSYHEDGDSELLFTGPAE